MMFKYWHPEKHKHAQRILASEPTSEPTAEGVEAILDFIQGLHNVLRDMDKYAEGTHGHLVLVFSKSTDQTLHDGLKALYEPDNNNYLWVVSDQKLAAKKSSERMGHIVARSVAGYRDVLVTSKRLDLYMLQLDVVFQRIRNDQIDVFYLNTDNKLYKLQLQADGTFAKTPHGREGIFTDDFDQEWNDSANY